MIVLNGDIKVLHSQSIYTTSIHAIMGIYIRNAKNVAKIGSKYFNQNIYSDRGKRNKIPEKGVLVFLPTTLMCIYSP